MPPSNTLTQDERTKWIKSCEILDQRWIDKVVNLGVISRENAEKLLKEVRATGAEVTA